MVEKTNQTRYYAPNNFAILTASHAKNDTNDVSFESPDTELLEFIKKLGMASSWGWPHPPN